MRISQVFYTAHSVNVNGVSQVGTLPHKLSGGATFATKSVDGHCLEPSLRATVWVNHDLCSSERGPEVHSSKRFEGSQLFNAAFVDHERARERETSHRSCESSGTGFQSEQVSGLLQCEISDLEESGLSFAVDGLAAGEKFDRHGGREPGRRGRRRNDTGRGAEHIAIDVDP